MVRIHSSRTIRVFCCCSGLVAFSAQNHARIHAIVGLPARERQHANKKQATINRAFGGGVQPERSLPRAREGPARGGAVSRPQLRRLFAIHPYTAQHHLLGRRKYTLVLHLAKQTSSARKGPTLIRPNPYSGTQVTATAECLSFSQARWSRTGILKRCSRALTVCLYSTYSSTSTRDVSSPRNIVLERERGKKPLAGDEIACRFFVARSQLGSQRRCYSAVASRPPKADRA